MGFTQIIDLITTYGPEAVTLIEGLVAKWQQTGSLTEADVETAFSTLKSYDQYGIPKAFIPPTV